MNDNVLSEEEMWKELLAWFISDEVQEKITTENIIKNIIKKSIMESEMSKGKFMTKLERVRHKLGALGAYYKKLPGSYRFTQEEAMAEMVDAMQYILFLIEESGINIHNRNDDYGG